MPFHALLHAHILASVSDGIHVIGLDGRVLIENAAASRMLGWSDNCLVGKNGHETIHHHRDDGQPFPVEQCPIFATSQDGKPREVLEDVFWRQDGSSFPVEYRTSPLLDEMGVLYGVTVVFRDITERKLAARRQAILHGISDAAHSCDSLDELFPQVQGLLGEVMPLSSLSVLIFGDDGKQLQLVFQGLGEPLAEVESLRRASQVVQGDGEGSRCCDENPTWLGAPLREGVRVMGALLADRNLEGRSCIEADMHFLQFAAQQLAGAIERTQREARLRYLAHYDALTGLPNRSLFEDRLSVALAQAHRRSESLALVYIDLDKFKPVNDTLGHAVGDVLLRQVAQRLKRALRASDSVARVGGDEFVALLQPATTDAEVLLVAEKIRSALAQAIDVEGHWVEGSASIGVALYPQHGADASALARSADAAMYRAKGIGGNRVELA